MFEMPTLIKNNNKRRLKNKKKKTK